MYLPTLPDLESAEQWVLAYADSQPRLAAEVLWVIARVYDEDRNDHRTALFCARKSIELFNQCSLNTAEECAARFVTLLGKALPSYIHQDVVLRHFYEVKNL